MTAAASDAARWGALALPRKCAGLKTCMAFDSLVTQQSRQGNYTSGFARLRFWQFCLHWQAFCLVIDGSSAAKVLARFEYRLC